MSSQLFSIFDYFNLLNSLEFLQSTLGLQATSELCHNSFMNPSIFQGFPTELPSELNNQIKIEGSPQKIQRKNVIRRTFSSMAEKSIASAEAISPQSSRFSCATSNLTTEYASPLCMTPFLNKSLSNLQSKSSLARVPPNQKQITSITQIPHFCIDEDREFMTPQNSMKKMKNNENEVHSMVSSESQKTLSRKKQYKINDKFDSKNENSNIIIQKQPTQLLSFQSSSSKREPQKNIIIQKASPKPVTRAPIFAEEIYLKSVSQEGAIRLQKFPCFRDVDLNIPQEYSSVIQQYSDDDKCSGNELLEKAVNYLHKKLVASVQEQKPNAVIPDADKVFHFNDIKIDRDSEEEEEEEEQEQNNQMYSQSEDSEEDRSDEQNDSSDDEDDSYFYPQKTQQNNCYKLNKSSLSSITKKQFLHD